LSSDFIGRCVVARLLTRTHSVEIERASDPKDEKNGLKESVRNFGHASFVQETHCHHPN
jgi:hypothetical protein